LLDDLGQPADLTITVTDTVSGGGAMEDIEESRRNLMYWWNDAADLLWDADYTGYIRKNISGIVFLKVWGEQEAEAVYGASLDHINMIFVSGYKPSVTDSALESDVLTVLNGKNPTGKLFEWVTPEFIKFTVNLTGKVGKDANIEKIISDIKVLLSKYYGKDSPDRKDAVRIKDIYGMIGHTGHFDGMDAWFEVNVDGTDEAVLNQVLIVDIENSGIGVIRG